jgi:Asp-tRNA(Asn)/Glu-tRNA(Gln) amidotransferase C subunit
VEEHTGESVKKEILMEQLSVLEKKLNVLLESKRNLALEAERCKEENARLREEAEQNEALLREEVVKLAAENAELYAKVEKLENTLLVRHQSIEGLNQERELTKMAMEDLIKSIDMLVGTEQEHQQ